MFLVSDAKKKFSIIEKIKSVKHFEIIVIAIFCSILLFIYFSTFKTKKTTENTLTTLTTEEYANYLENKLSNVLAHISGAGNVSVMITLCCGVEYVYATDTTEETTSQTTNGTTTTKTTKKEEVLLVSVSGKSSPIILQENLPKVSGVVVVASGAKNISVRLELQKAVEALLDVNPEAVEILIGD